MEECKLEPRTECGFDGEKMMSMKFNDSEI
jgi:hypothetical protein